MLMRSSEFMQGYIDVALLSRKKPTTKPLSAPLSSICDSERLVLNLLACPMHV